MTLRVDSIGHLRALNDGTASLEDVLVLRVTDGRDHFLPIRATWLPSSFGRSIEELIRIPPRSGGIRGFAKEQTSGEKEGLLSKTKALLKGEDETPKVWQNGSIPNMLDVHGSSPVELYKLTSILESLTERAIADENMLEDEQAKIPRDLAGWPFDSGTRKHLKVINGDYDVDTADQLATLIEAVDMDADLATAFAPTLPAIHRMELAALALVLFLTSLTDGVLSQALWAKIEDSLPNLGSGAASRTAEQLEADKTIVLDILSQSPYHNISFVFITAMLSKIASDLLPLAPEDAQSLSEDPGRILTRRSGLGRMGLSLRARKGSESRVDEAAIQRRLSWEHRAAEIFGPAMCRSEKDLTKLKEKERKFVEEKMAILVDEFMRRDGT